VIEKRGYGVHRRRRLLSMPGLLSIMMAACCVFGSPHAVAQSGSDSTDLPYPSNDSRSPLNRTRHPLHLNRPTTQVVQFDPLTGRYMLREKVGDVFIGEGIPMTYEEYLAWEREKNKKSYWRERTGGQASGNIEREGIIPKIYVGPKVFDKIFGGSYVDIRPQGSAELRFAGNMNYIDNPNLTVQQRRIGNFDFDMNIQMTVVGAIGEKLKFTASQNTQAVFNFENQMKLEYTGFEDEIIKKIEIGNVNLPLRSALIQGSQSLFGLKAEMQFGRLRVTTVLSQQRGQSQSVAIEGGAQTTRFDIPVDQYDANRHFFLAQHFRDQFNTAMSSIPVVRSNVVVTRVEVWVTNRNQISTDVRDVVGFMDLGESRPHSPVLQTSGGLPFPRNDANNLYSLLIDPANVAARESNRVLDILETAQPLANLRNAADYEITFARKLDPNQYTFHPLLGFVSLNSALNNDEVVAVAYEYTINGELFRVGEFSQEVPSQQDNPTVLFLKLLKGTTIRTDLPIWDLMMKNIYSLNAFQLSQQDFILNIVYNDVLTGNKNFIPEGSLAGQQLIQVLGLDRLNVQLEPQPDGIFDFVPGLTVDIQRGRIMFPRIEPFGRDLEAAFDAAGPTSEATKRKYVFQPLYDSTRAWAQLFPELNRFRLIGQYKSASGSEISLGAMNIPPNSVRVSAGTRQLVEGQDFTVDYTLGRVKIINPSLLSSGEQINVSFENNPLFQATARTLSATRFDYRLNRDVNLGATLLHLNERPITPKVNQGEEPIRNTMLGLDMSAQTESQLVTRIIDKLPFISTKEISTVQFMAEYARLIPGNARAIAEGGGISYIDDFEAAESNFDLKSFSQWHIASTPSNFPESALRNDLSYGFNRAKLNWYNIDPLFFRNAPITPEHLRNDLESKSNHYTREILEQEVFPNKQLANNQPLTIPTFDLAYYPTEKGPYNYDALPSAVSAGVDAQGNLLNPRSRWGGIQRKIETNDFEAANIEFIEFWMLDPFIYKTSHNGGDLYINLGNVSEDILKDGRRSFENGLPRADGGGLVDTTAWGIVPRLIPLVNAFDNDPNSRATQDVGLDGLNDVAERAFFADYLAQLEQAYGVASPAYQRAFSDPSNDNYHHYRGSNFDAAQLSVLSRYKRFNGLEGNSPTDQQSPEPYPTSATNLPNTEDINFDNTLTQAEDYFEYRISLRPGDMVVGRNYISDIFEATVQLRNRTSATVNWYQFRVPVQSPDRRVGNVLDFKSIRFIRMFMTGFDDSVVCRFATLQLVRTDWRRYLSDLQTPGEYVPIDRDQSTLFLLSTVNIEENGNRLPIPYVVPPGIERVRNVFTTNFQQLNEQALQLRFCNLRDGDARAAFKNTRFDIRAYKRIEMFIHAEGPELRDLDVNAFVRFGNDYVQNYYEYEQPLYITPPGSTDPFLIWPEINNFNVTFSELNAAKQMRNDAGWPLSLPYTVINDKGHRITVLGNPNLSNIQTIMLGVRNPKSSMAGGGLDDDGLDKCGEVWFNELRLTDFDNRDGWAATGMVNMRLADFGSVNITGLRKTIGFGGIESQVSSRSRDDLMQYDISSTFELSKFFPERFGLRIPMYFGFGEGFSRPEFNPIDGDILLTTLLDGVTNPRARDSIIRASETYTLRRAINFTNVQKMRTSRKKARPWDIENLNVTLSYSENYNRNPFVASNSVKNYRGSLGYNFSNQAKNVRPFANVGAFKGKHMMWIRDFNFFYAPQNVSIRTDLDRLFQTTQLRNNADGGLGIPPTYNKNFTWNRFYNIRYDLTRSLKVEFDASMASRIDEPFGPIDTEEKRDTIIQNLKNLGRPTRYNQNVNINYQLPFNKFRKLDWINSSYQYQTTYEWTAAPLAAEELGNIIQNSQTNRLNANLNFTNLYNKSSILKKILTDQPLRDQPKKQEEEKTKTVRKKDQFGDDTNQTEMVKKAAPVDEKPDYSLNIPRHLVKMILMIKNASANYSLTQGTILPGFNQSPQFFGNNFDLDAPGLPFVFGDQRDLRPTIIQRGWLVTDTNLNAMYMTTRNISVQGQATVEPFKDFRIILSVLQTQNFRFQQNFRANSLGDISEFNSMEQGDYSVSIISWRTAFERIETNPQRGNYLESSAFRQFEFNRLIMAERLGELNPNSIGRGAVDTVFPDGYSRQSLEVLIPSFLSAYTGQDASTMDLGIFPRLPMPNWRITYNGLTRMAWARNIFQSLTLNHSYRSTYTVGNFSTNLIYRETNGFVSSRDTVITRDFHPRYQITQITISEQMAPLVGIDATLKNNFTVRVEYKQMRTLTLTLLNNRMNEMRTNEMVIGVGYRIANPNFSFIAGGNASTAQNDLNVRFDLNIRDNVNLLRDLDGAEAQPSGGGRNLSIKPSADYVLNDRVNLRFFYDYVLNTPFVSTTFPNRQTSGGLIIRFTIAN
jgi:cell surface protein SprA